MNSELKTQNSELSKPPAFFTSWSRLYALVLIELALLVIAFYAFMKTFS